MRHVGPLAKTWFWLNGRASCWLGNNLVAAHPQIAVHLRTRVRAESITTIPFGADVNTAALTEPVHAMGLQCGRFMTVIARPEPENSLLEVVTTYSARPRGRQLVVMGQL